MYAYIPPGFLLADVFRELELDEVAKAPLLHVLVVAANAENLLCDIVLLLLC